MAITQRFADGEDELLSLKSSINGIAPLPVGLVTHGPVHRFDENQPQINGGRNDGFVAWGNVGAMLIGYYGDSSVNLRLWNIARDFTLCDNFFMGAFGGSLLNHQYLVAAQPPHYPDADKSPSKGMVAVLEGDDPTGHRLKMWAKSPASAMQGKPEFASHNTLTPDHRVVNTMGPPYSPAFTRDPKRPAYALATKRYTLSPQTRATIHRRHANRQAGRLCVVCRRLATGAGWARRRR